MIGQTVGSYTIMSELGEGGMGKVYLARHALIGRRAAVKVLNPSIASDEEAVSRFFTEARLVNDIRHPNIVEVTDFGQFAGFYCIVMELLEGETLAARIQRVRSMEESDALRIVKQVTSALGAAHEQGMVHRDLKPENIFLRNHPDYPDFVKVLDFGIAKLLGNESPLGHHTKTGAVIGTPAYMSPEQCLGESSLDLRSDIYSLGVVLYEALTGRPPFVGDTLGRLIVCHVNEAPPPPVSVNPRVSAMMNSVVLRALQKKPKDRFGSMKDFREALELANVRPPAAPAQRQRSISRAVPIDMRGGQASGPIAVGPPAAAPRPIVARAPTPPPPPPSGEITSVDLPEIDDAQDLVTRLATLVLDRLATGRIELPALPAASERCMELLRLSNLAFAEAARTLEKTPALRSRVMRLANSAVFPSLMPATTLDMAITRLGTEGLYGALIEFAAREVLETGRHVRVRESLRRSWIHSIGVANIAANLCELIDRDSDATFGYLSGLLHAIGKPVVGGLLIDVEQQMIKTDSRMQISEAAWLGAVEASHGPVGAAVARKWKLAHPVAEAIEAAVAYDPIRGRRSLGNIVRFSVALAQRLGLTVGPMAPGAAGDIVAEGRDLMGIDERIMRVLSHGLKERATVLAGIRGQ